jgi:hypothetical protein
LPGLAASSLSLGGAGGSDVVTDGQSKACGFGIWIVESGGALPGLKGAIAPVR